MKDEHCVKDTKGAIISIILMITWYLFWLSFVFLNDIYINKNTPELLKETNVTKNKN